MTARTSAKTVPSNVGKEMNVSSIVSVRAAAPATRNSMAQMRPTLPLFATEKMPAKETPKYTVEVVQ